MEQPDRMRDNSTKNDDSSFLPKSIGHLCGSRSIAGVFGVGRSTIRAWKKAGAPIYIVGHCYQANYAELWEWLQKHEKTSFFNIT